MLALPPDAADGNAPMRSERVDLTNRQQHFDIPADRAPSALSLDRNTWMLVEATMTTK